MAEAELYSVYKGVCVRRTCILRKPEILRGLRFPSGSVLIVTYPKSVPWLEEHRAILLGLEQRPSPRVFATHFHRHMMSESYFKTKPRVLYVMRNPKDVFTSSFHYYGMASYLVNPGSQDEFMEKFLDGTIIFGSWFDHVKGWIGAEEQESILHIFYEEMIADLKGSVEKIAKFLGIAGDWKNHFTEAQQQRFNSVYKDKMRDVKFKFTWD
ncbi:sulfotransferase 2B1-like [Puntigrus tetrazona]|uniref:sulfotransferase 2B1-like n=1 Tax=Puntigrus tetrazona TaxID=1606681 RepID=UPI001C8A2DFB|nr:sulfotransferase 2B1-like [Puntigrus tetrazona]